MKIFNFKKMKEFIVYEALVQSETKQQNNTDIIIGVVCVGDIAIVLSHGGKSNG